MPGVSQVPDLPGSQLVQDLANNRDKMGKMRMVVVFCATI